MKKRGITSGKSANKCVVYQLVVMPDRHQHHMLRWIFIVKSTPYVHRLRHLAAANNVLECRFLSIYSC